MKLIQSDRIATLIWLCGSKVIWLHQAHFRRQRGHYGGNWLRSSTHLRLEDKHIQQWAWSEEQWSSGGIDLYLIKSIHLEFNSRISCFHSEVLIRHSLCTLMSGFPLRRDMVWKWRERLQMEAINPQLNRLGVWFFTFPSLSSLLACFLCSK